MTAEKASEVLVKTTGELNAYKRRVIRNNAKRAAKGRAGNIVADTPIEDDLTNSSDDDILRNTSANELATDETSEQTDDEAANESAHQTDPSDSSSSSSDSDDNDKL